MLPRLGAGGLAVLLLTARLVPAQQPPPAPAREEPRETGLVERAERRLVQLDVSVSGPRQAIQGLSASDFELAVGGRRIESFEVDDLCRPPAPQAEPPRPPAAEPQGPAEAVAAAPAVAPSPTTFLFYFDQPHLTMAGRQNALDLSRDLVRELIVGGNRGIVMSNGQELKTFADATSDPPALLEALERLEQDRQQWVTWPWQEEDRIREVLDDLNGSPTSLDGGSSGNIDRALSTARLHQAEDRWRTEKALRMLSVALGRLADLEPPKAIVYFADTMRANAGDHYLSFFGERWLQDRGSNYGGFTAAHSFDRVVEEATSLGIRFYTIEAQGLTNANPDLALSAETASGRARPTANTRRIKDAQNSLVGLALESGGQAFLNGVRASRIAAEIEKDLSCIYLLSFDAAELPEDQALRVSLRVTRPKVDVRARGQLLVPSKSRTLSSRLLAAFAASDEVDSEFALRVVVVPTGFEQGRYSALVQLHVAGSPLPATTWDLGMSLVSRGAVRDDASGQVSVSAPWVPVVFETAMRFAPGPYEIVAVVHEHTGNQVATARIEGSWPDPDAASVTVGPIAILQPSEGAFLRGTEPRRSGSVAVAEEDTARPDRPTALVGIVCRERSRKGSLRVERRLVGESAAPFEPLEVSFEGEERCALIRDIVRSATMSPGEFRYEVRVFDGADEIAAGERAFAVMAGGGGP
jgi:VWFA-related protein